MKEGQGNMGSKRPGRPKDEAPGMESALSPLRVFGSFSPAEKEQYCLLNKPSYSNYNSTKNDDYSMKG
jgi:hypothetical protein